MNPDAQTPAKLGIASKLRAVIDVARNAIGWRRSEAALTQEARAWWEDPGKKNQGMYSHWRESFEDATWLAIGRQTFDIYESFSRSMQFPRPAKRVIEWGCGGGANAVHFAREADSFFGVDVAQVSLDECGRQLRREGMNNFHPVLIDLSEPEGALSQIDQPCDLFVCIYVFEAFPTPEYGKRVLRIAAKLLRPGAMALIQVKYSTGIATRSRGWGYRFGVANMTTYRLDEFWQVASECGFEPHAIHLIPRQTLVPDERYGYFLLRRV
ncbi:MAG: class I SAM-dependent methyltransferase [Steroidobacteraceae bacterium]